MTTYSMTQECVDSYRVDEDPNGGIVIRISIPKRFADLWLTKLSELRVSDADIADFQATNPLPRHSE